MARIRAVQGGAGRVRTGVRGSSGAAAVPPVPAAGVATTPSYNFTIDNALVASNQNGLIFPATAMNTPATASNGWVAGFSFRIPYGMEFLTLSETLAQKGTTNNAGGGADAAFWVNQAASAANPLAFGGTLKSASFNFFTVPNTPVTRGMGYTFAFGQVGTNYFYVLIDTSGNIIVSASGAVGATINSYQVYAGLGCGVGLASGNARGFSGAMANAFMVWGNLESTATAAATSSKLVQMATGLTDIKAINTAIGGTLRYYNKLAGPSGLTADAAGTVTGAMAVISTWTPSVPGQLGEPIIPQPWLTLTPEGDNGYYVWGIKPGQTTGRVWFRGQWATSNVVTPTFEVQLVRKDNGTTLVDWTALQGLIISGNTYSGYIDSVSGGVGFSRSVRFSGNSSTVCVGSEKHAVGIVLVFNAQSQAAMMFGIGAAGGGSGIGAVTATDTANQFVVSLKPPIGLSDTVPAPPNQTNGPNNDVYAFKPVLSTNGTSTNTTTQVCLVGDGILALADRLMAISNLPVMLCDDTNGGHSPQNFYCDRQTVTLTGAGGNGWSPNGATTSFTVALGAPSTVAVPFLSGKPNPLGGAYGSTLPYAAGTAGVSSPMVSQTAGTFTATLSNGTVITETAPGSGVLTGSGVSGTLTYSTPGGFPSCALTFSVAPAGGVTLAATWQMVTDYISGSNTPKATPLGFSSGGVPGRLHTGQTANVYYMLWKNQVTAVVFPWWTTLLAAVGTYSGSYSTLLSNLYPQLDALKYWHQQYSNVANALFFYAPAARECPTSGSSELSSTYGAHRFATYSYVKDNPTDTRLLASVNEATINGNSGPHEDFFGYQLMGQRYGVSIAAGLGYGSTVLYSGTDNSAHGIPAAPVMGPVLTGVTRKNSTTLTLTFALPNGTSLSSYGGLTAVGTTIVGFEVGTSSTSQALAYTGRAIASGTIQSATTIDVTTPTQLTFVSLSYCAGYNVFTGIANYTADTANLKNLLCDNAGGYTLPTAGNGAGPAAGNGAQSVLDWAA